MKRVVFYSWQSDLPNPTNRGFVQQALGNAVKTITNDDTVTVEPVVDRDTQGVAGSPDIASTIFAKITASDVFVADISIISSAEAGRPTPNPNVLIELGYALRGLGHERIVLVFNQSFGKIEDLPFDLRMRRLVTYSMSPEEKERAPERTKLEKQLEGVIRSALDVSTEQEEEPEIIPAITAIENNQPNKIIVLRRNLDALLKKIDSLQPKKYSDGGTVEELKSAIYSTQELVVEFSKIIETISIMKDQDSALEAYRWFGNIFEQYNDKPGTNGRTSNADHDYFKFIGHELYVTFITFFLREKQWGIIKKVLQEPIPIKYRKHDNGPSNMDWSDVSEHLPSLLDESTKTKRPSVHADILNERHKKGGLSSVISIEEFAATDFFLFLLGELPDEGYKGGNFTWRPWSVLYMKNVPAFIKNAEYTEYAKELAQIYNIPSVAEFKKRLKERYPVIHRLFSRVVWFTCINDGDIDKIATK